MLGMVSKTQNEPLLLTETEAGKIIGFSPRTLQRWRVDGNGPKFLRISPRAIRYLREDLDEWIRERSCRSTSEDLPWERRNG